MKKASTLFLFFASLLLLSSCRDTPEKLVEDYQSLYEEACEVLDALHKGEISITEAEEELVDFKSDFQKLLDRRAELEDDGKLVEGSEEYEVIIESLMPIHGKFMNLIMILEGEGKMSPTLKKSLGYDL